MGTATATVMPTAMDITWKCKGAKQMVALKTKHTESRTQTRAAIGAGARTPMVKMGGALRDMHVADLAKTVIQETLYRANWPADRIDEVIVGNVVMPADAANLEIGRASCRERGKM